MSISELSDYLDRSLRGVPEGELQLGSKTYAWRQWEGESLASKLIAVDTETELCSVGQVPKLAVMQAYDGQVCYLVHPTDVGAFFDMHAQAGFVAHNAAFDWHVLHRHLKRCQRRQARLWLAVVDEHRLSDTMLLDQLVRLAYGSPHPVPRNLGAVAARWAGISDLDKTDPWRLRYGETIGVPWRGIDRAAWHYAAKDAIATRLAFVELRSAARKLSQRHAVDAAALDEYGPLTVRLQVRAAIALHATELRGICVDQSRRQDAERALRELLARQVQQLEAIPEFRDVFRYDKKGQLLLTGSGKPRIAQKRLRAILQRVACEHAISAPATSSGEISLARDFWRDHVEIAPFLLLWLQLEESAKLLQFFGRLGESRIHPRYNVVVRTGRTSCHSPNIQQMPRAGTFREMFVPRPGFVFLILDYTALELRTLATVCLRQFGASVLADTLREGRDPHCFTAAMLSGMTYDRFHRLKQSSPGKYKRLRQAAKAVNFGVPGGLGAVALAQYARLSYGVDMSVKQAARFRQRFLKNVYPEIGEYMADDTVEVLAANLGCRRRDVIAALPSPALRGAARRIVQGLPRRTGEAYESVFEASVWQKLQALSQRPDLSETLRQRRPTADLERELFFGAVVTPTGRVRGKTSFTQRRNTPFQGLAADGAKIALWDLFRAGYRVVSHIHDEFVIELPGQSDWDQEAAAVERICVGAMERVTAGVPIACEYSVASCWSKDATLVRDATGKIQLWTPDVSRSLDAPEQDV
jgi:hypothetical protein